VVWKYANKIKSKIFSSHSWPKACLACFSFSSRSPAARVGPAPSPALPRRATASPPPLFPAWAESAQMFSLRSPACQLEGSSRASPSSLVLTGGASLSGQSPTSSPRRTPPLPMEAVSMPFLTPPSPCALRCPAPYKPSCTLRRLLLRPPAPQPSSPSHCSPRRHELGEPSPSRRALRLFSSLSVAEVTLGESAVAPSFFPCLRFAPPWTIGPSPCASTRPSSPSQCTAA